MTSAVRADIYAGAKDSLSVGLGVFPLGLALGVLVIGAGLPWWVCPALSIIVFAGSVELLLVSLISAGTSLLTIGITVLAINFRHVFYAFSFPLTRIRSLGGRAYSVYALIDEAYATYAAKDPAELTGKRILTMQLCAQAFWVLGGLVGLVIAQSLPAPLEGFEFALCALFTVMTLDALRSSHQIPSALLAGVAVAVALWLYPEAAILVALCTFFTLLVLRYYLNHRRTRRSQAQAQARTP